MAGTATVPATVLVSAVDAAVTARLVRALGGTLVAAGGRPVAGSLALELGRVELGGSGVDGSTLCLLGCRPDHPVDLLAQAVGHGVLGHLVVVGTGPVQPLALEVLTELPTVVALTGRAGEKAVRTALRASGVPLLRCDPDDGGSVRTVLAALLRRAYEARAAI